MSWPEIDRIRPGVANMLRVNLGVKDGESVLVVTDIPTSAQWRELPLEELQGSVEASVLARMVADLACTVLPRVRVTFLPFPSLGRHGVEPGPEVAEAMQASDVVVAITTHSLTHTEASRLACQAGTRVASMPGFRARMFEGPMKADYRRVAEDCDKMAGLLTRARVALLTTADGTRLTLVLEGRAGDVDNGFVTCTARPINLPGGEAFIVPLEGRAEGKVVVTPRGYVQLPEAMTLHFEAGEVSKIEGGAEVGEEYRELLELPGRARQAGRRNLAELGIGTNPEASSVESTLEAEKIKGTVHIAIGDNSVMGGTVHADMHQDFVLWEPNLYLDDRPVIEKGEWLV
jgi:leucyl aminopeptidase (aminopeptidase T)